MMAVSIFAAAFDHNRPTFARLDGGEAGAATLNWVRSSAMKRSKAFQAPVLWLAVLLCVTVVGPAAAKCQLEQAAELHVIVDQHRALIPVVLNGHEGLMIVDTGAGSSMLFRDAVQRLGLPTHYVSGALRVYGVGGQTRPSQAVIDNFQLSDSYKTKNMTIMVAGEHSLAGPQVVGLLGQDIFGSWDIELDLAHGVIRLLHPVDCHGDQVVYWGAAYAKAKIEFDPSVFVHTTTQVQLNGKTIDAYLDTGANTSVVTLAAAARAGVTPSSPKVQKMGYARGVGAFDTTEWIATFDSFAIGEETIHNAKIHMADMFQHATHEETGSRLAHQEENLPSMLLGFDFFQAHHVLIANSQHMIYFSYNGGPVFDTSSPAPPAPPGVQIAPAATPSAAPPRTGAAPATTPAGASGGEGG